MNLTRIAIKRPTLAFVFVATMILAGSAALQQLVVQAEPDAAYPTIDIRLEYSGSPASFIRDHIVRPLEDQIAGSPGLVHIDSVVELGAADITVQFRLDSTREADLAYVEQSLQAAQSQLPPDLIAPVTRVVDPAQGTVATIAVHSRKMSTANLAQYANVQIMPNIEQLGGISDAHVVNLPQAAFEVTVEPAALAAAGLTLTDVVNTISQNNVHAPGGLIYGKYETQIDVRGDLPDEASIAKLPIAGAPPPFAVANTQGVPASSGVSYAGNGAGGAAAGSGGGPGGNAGLAAGGAGGIPSAASSGNAAGATGMAGGNLPVAVGNTTQPTSTAGSANGPGSVGVSLPPLSTAQMAATGYAAANAPASTAGSTALSSAGGSGSPSTGSAGASATTSTGTGANRAGISLPPGTVGSPAPQVPTTIGAGSNAAANVPAPPMPQVTSPLTSTPGLMLGPGVGALAPYSAGSPNRKLGDFASVVLGSKPVRTYEVLDGKPGVEMQMLKFANASEITVAKEIEDELPQIRAKFPGIDFRIDHVQATYSRAQVDGVLRTVVESIVLVAIVMLFFLKSWRNAVVVCIAIPTSLAVTVIAMRVMGLTLDVVSLLAMSLVIGTLVDDSTVVLENAERHREAGEAPADAALNGRTEIGTAAVVITLVDVVVFLPIAFLGGVVGKQLAEFGIVVSVATLTSLFVSFAVTPTLAGRWSMTSAWRPWRIIERFDRGFRRVAVTYNRRVLPAAIARPTPWLAVTGILLAIAFALFPTGVIGREYIPAGDRPDVFVQIFYPSGTSLDRTRDLTTPLDAKLNAFGDAESVETSYGSFETSSNIVAEESSAAQLHVYLKAGTDTTAAIDRIRTLARSQLPPSAVVVVFPANSETGAPSREIEEIVSHQDDSDPARDAEKVAAVLRGTPGARDVINTSKNLAPEVQIQFDRELARTLNVPIGAASTAIRAAFGGATASQITTENGLVQIDVIYPRTRQLSLSEIAAVPIRTNDGRIVHVGDVTHLKYEAAPAVFTREDRADVVRISAGLEAGYALSNVLDDFNHRLKQLNLDDNVVVAPAAQSNASMMNDALGEIGASLLGSIVLVYLLMVALYNSYRSPLIVLLAIPPATIGAAFALAVTHQTLNLYSLIGTILLVGLVTKNSILLVDYANTLRRTHGHDRDRAIRESARTRFRPIVMTTIAVVIGLLPVALGLDPGASSRRALGIVVIGGLTSSLLLTLVLVPLFYRWLAPKTLREELRFADEQGATPAAA